MELSDGGCEHRGPAPHSGPSLTVDWQNRLTNTTRDNFMQSRSVPPIPEERKRRLTESLEAQSIFRWLAKNGDRYRRRAPSLPLNDASYRTKESESRAAKTKPRPGRVKQGHELPFGDMFYGLRPAIKHHRPGQDNTPGGRNSPTYSYYMQ